jgi:hypothetical protein
MTRAPVAKPVQDDLFLGAERSLLDQLLTESRLYRTSADYKALLDFVVRLRNFAPFNAMLLHIQKPGLTYAASARDWRERFGRWPKEHARPLLILRPFGPVALVYDVMDTDGMDLPESVERFFARGPIGERDIDKFRDRTSERNIDWEDLDAGDAKAGSICCVARAFNNDGPHLYRMLINKNHSPAIQFATLTHELAHLFLGHLGPDKALGIRDRARPNYQWEELEAESVAFIVCARNDVKSKSESYLAKFVETNTTIEDLDIYAIMHAADQIEALLGLGAKARFSNGRKGQG